MNKIITTITIGIVSLVIGIAVGWFVREKVIARDNKAKNVAAV